MKDFLDFSSNALMIKWTNKIKNKDVVTSVVIKLEFVTWNIEKQSRVAASKANLRPYIFLDTR